MENNANIGPEERTDECRICRDSDNTEQLISPCNCTGSMKFIHITCFLDWVGTSGHLECVVCKTNYRHLLVRRQNLWSFIKQEFRELLSILIITLLISSFMLLATYFLLQMDLDTYNRLVAKRMGNKPEFKRYTNLRDFYLFKVILIMENLFAFIAIWALFAIAVRDEWNQHLEVQIDDREINV